MADKKIILLFLSFYLAACNNPQKASDTTKTYFDLRGFFESEAARLAKVSPAIEKTVVQNESRETKVLKITDWKTELSLFVESDLNKPAWKDSYRVKKKGMSTEYQALDKKLRTQVLEVIKTPDGSVKQINIRNRAVNPLYSTIETLSYSPDSAYIINKHQDVLILGENTFNISGKFRTNN